jgi:histidine triad (HIT) family protein
MAIPAHRTSGPSNVRYNPMRGPHRPPVPIEPPIHGESMSDARPSDCIFCSIVGGHIPATLVHEEPDLLAFEDVNPQAPIHILFIPRRHVASLDSLEPADEGLAGRLLLAAGEVARRRGLDETGYRVVTNVGKDGGQSVSHLHLHLLGGRGLGWPPG